MANKLQTLLKQIAKLQTEADSLRSKEKVGVIERIRDAIAHYDITADELFGDVKVKRGRAKSPAAGTATKVVRKSAKSVGVAKYTDGAGRTWSGVGKRPNWFKEALAAGKTAEDLLVSK